LEEKEKALKEARAEVQRLETESGQRGAEIESLKAEKGRCPSVASNKR
jgi:hypothetical protein